MSMYESMTDEQLALSYIEGNNKAFDEILLRHKDQVFGYIMYVVKDDEVANDLFQETFLKVITKLQNGKYRDNGKFAFWLMRIAHNVIIDHYRAQKNDPFVEPTKDNDLQNLHAASIIDTDHESELAAAQILKDVKRMMNALPDSQRDVVFMRFFQQLSFKEIAEQTEVSINTALGRMRYALINLRKMTRQYDIILTTR